MKKYTFIIPFFFILSSCSSGTEMNLPNKELIETGSTQTNEIPIVDEYSSGIQDFGSGFILSSIGKKNTLKYNEEVIKEWDESVRIRVESFDSRFYKIYRDLDNDFQIWVYDTISGNIHEFGNGKMGDIIERIGISENAINFSTKYSDSKIHLNENPYNFPLGKITGMYLTFSSNFSKLLSWQYQEYYRKVNLETDKEILMEYLLKKGRSNFTIDQFQLEGSYFKNAAYIGGINSGCSPDGNNQICTILKFFAIIDNNGEVVYFEETSGDYECKDIEKSLSGKVLKSVGEKFCPQFSKIIYDNINEIILPEGEKVAKILQSYIGDWPRINTIERSFSSSGFTIFRGTSDRYSKRGQKWPDSNFFAILDQEYNQIYYEGITAKEYFEGTGTEFACENISTQTGIISSLRESYCQ